MRVALFTDTYLPDVNGVANTLGRWVHYLESRGVECKVFAPSSEGAQQAGSSIVERFYSIPFLLYPECRMAIPNPIHINKTLKAFQPDLVHVATPFNLGLVGLHYAKRNNVPFVASYHTHFDQYLSFYKLQWMEPMLWKYMLWFHQECCKIYVPSESTRLHLREKGLSRLEIWSRGVEGNRFHPFVSREKVWKSYGVDPDRFIILYVGRLAPEKSIDVLMQTFSSLPDAIRNNAQLVITGEGPLYEPLLEEYGSRKDIIFTGFKMGNELNELYAAADLFLFPSATETFGNVILEAMSAGTAVIGCAAGGVKDNVRTMVNGMLCEPGSIEQFVHAVEMMYHNEELRLKLSQEARKYSLQQSWDRIFSRLFESYLGVVSGAESMKRQKAAPAK